MEFHSRLTRHALLACAMMIMAGCADLKTPAQQAIADVESAISAAAPDASKYVPDQLADVQAKLDSLKASFARQDYKAVISGAAAVKLLAQNVASAAAAKKDETMKALTGDWTQLATSVPQLLAAVQTRLAAFAKHKKLPPGVDLNAAQAAFADATSLWSKAQAAFAASNLEEAVNTAKECKSKAETASAALKLDTTTGAPAK